MAFFDRMKDSLTTAGQEVSQKAKNATENVRLGNLIKNNDKMVDKLLYQVGLKYYEAHGQEEGTEYQELFADQKMLHISRSWIIWQLQTNVRSVDLVTTQVQNSALVVERH